MCHVREWREGNKYMDSDEGERGLDVPWIKNKGVQSDGGVYWVIWILKKFNDGKQSICPVCIRIIRNPLCSLIFFSVLLEMGYNLLFVDYVPMDWYTRIVLPLLSLFLEKAKENYLYRWADELLLSMITLFPVSITSLGYLLPGSCLLQGNHLLVLMFLDNVTAHAARKRMGNLNGFAL